MNSRVHNAAAELVERAHRKGIGGRLADPILLDELIEDSGEGIPDWYVDLILTIPVCGLTIGIMTPDSQDDAGIMWMEWSDEICMRIESLECYPGISILEYGFINCGVDISGDGNPFFFNSHDGEDPAVYRFLYGYNADPETICDRDYRMIAPNMSKIFLNCYVR